MERLGMLTEKISSYIWSLPMVLMIVVVGLILTVRLRGIQLRELRTALRLIFQSERDAQGEVSSFGALCTALAATIGTGNIVGVATAICTGGPGALLWMVLTALLGMATQYAEGLLAVKYRTVDKNGRALGGPFYYIERGMGERWKPLAKAFAVCTVVAGLCGIGTLTQISSITSAVQGFFDPSFDGEGTAVFLFGAAYSGAAVLSGLLVTLAAAMVLLGGMRRIARVSEFVVPFMAVGYTLINMILLLYNFEKIPGAVMMILKGAFHPQAVTGGAVGSVFMVIQKGISRGVFTNEAGMGTAAIAAATAKTSEPARQGLVAMTGTFIDTVLLCSMTGLSIIITGAWDAGMEGAAVTTLAFVRGLPFPERLSPFLLMVSLIFFAFATILGWHVYAERCLDYLTNSNVRIIRAYRWLYILALLLGPYISLEVIWNLADITNGMMAIPNLIALFALGDVVVAETKAYYRRQGGR